MNQNDFLAKLKKLPADTPITAVHIAAILETLSDRLDVRPEIDFDSLSQSKLIDEDTLAEWLGESPSTLQKWRVKGGGPKFVRMPKSVRYSVGEVRDWIGSHTVSSTSEAHVKGLSKFEATGGIDSEEFAWNAPYPVIVSEDRYVGFFRSLINCCEIEPDGFVMVRTMALSALQPPKPPVNEPDLERLLNALSQMTEQVVANPVEARKTYGEWEKRITDTQRLGFFECALLLNLDLAKDIGRDFSPGFLAENFNSAEWLWKNLVEHDENVFRKENPAYAFAYLTELNVNINRCAHIKDLKGRDIFVGTVAQLLADTMGENFHLTHPNQESSYYPELLKGLLENGLDINAVGDDNAGKPAMQIADEVNHAHGAQVSQFSAVLNRYQLFEKLQLVLAEKPKIKKEKTFLK